MGQGDPGVSICVSRFRHPKLKFRMKSKKKCTPNVDASLVI